MQFKRHDFIRLQRGVIEKLAKAEQELAKAEKDAQEALAQGKRETAQNMLREQIPVDTISKCTGIGREEIERLRNSG